MKKVKYLLALFGQTDEGNAKQPCQVVLFALVIFMLMVRAIVMYAKQQKWGKYLFLLQALTI